MADNQGNPKNNENVSDQWLAIENVPKVKKTCLVNG